jgi:hypothetical protein
LILPSRLTGRLKLAPPPVTVRIMLHIYWDFESYFKVFANTIIRTLVRGSCPDTACA